MSGVELKPVDKRGPVIHLPVGKTTVGRGPFLGCTDKRISRNHAVLEVTSDGRLTLTPIHVNPCFKVNGDASKPFTKDVAHALCHGDHFSMLPSAYEYEVIITYAKTSEGNDVNANIQNVTKKKETEPQSDDNLSPAQLKQLIPSKKNESSPVKDDSAAPIPEATKLSRVEIADRKAEALLSSDPIPSTSSNSTKRKRVLPGWLIDAAEQQGKIKPETTPSKRTPIAKTNNSRKQDSGAGKTETKRPSAAKEAKAKKANTPPKANSTANVASRNSNYDMSEGSDEDVPSNDNVSKKAAVKRTAADYAMSDEGSDEDTRHTASKDSKPSPKKKRNICMYGAKCYRKNPAHFKEFCHPGDDDYESDPGGAGDRSHSPADDDSNDSRPECEFGLNCYRKNPQHRKDYKHTAQRQPPRAAAKKAKARSHQQKDVSGSEDEDSDDSFIDDDSEPEYKPESGEDSDDDPSLLIAEAEKFKRNKKLLKPA